MDTTYYLSIDLGATSGRSIIASFDGRRIEMRQLTRFVTPMIQRDGHVFWGLDVLHDEILKALSEVARQGIPIKSIGIDTWGCDVALFGKDGKLLSLPFSYRDPHTDGEVERYFDACMPSRELYQRTGIQFMPFNTLFQLSVLRRQHPDLLQQADKILFMPDALIYMLTGEAVMEQTIASTSQMYNPMSCDLDPKILSTLGLERNRFGRLVRPGEQVGHLSPAVQAATGIGPVPVVAVGSHDTASAVAAVPASDGNYAYLSCGTWSLLGIESPDPIISEESFAHNFTNEGGLDGTTRFLKNITGLWLLEQSRKEWLEGLVPSDVNELNALCLASSCQSIINPDDPRFAHPDSMTAAIRSYLEETDQPLPQSPADYVRIIFRSLAHRYAEIVELLRTITPVDIRRLHVIGGGSRNEFLMQFAADALRMPVIAGPQEGTALGNALVQVRADGFVDSLKDMRRIITNSIELRTYQPQTT